MTLSSPDFFRNLRCNVVTSLKINHFVSGILHHTHGVGRGSCLLSCATASFNASCCASSSVVAISDPLHCASSSKQVQPPSLGAYKNFSQPGRLARVQYLVVAFALPYRIFNL